MKCSWLLWACVICSLALSTGMVKGEYAITNGSEWTVFPYRNEIKAGGILDFSNLIKPAEAGASELERLVVDKNGHLVGERSHRRVRLVGANLNFSANTLEEASRGATDPEKAKELEHAACNRLATHFRRMGYNSVRFHHIDVILQKGGWNAWKSDDIDPRMLDRLDYMFHAMKQAGLYVTTDLYQMRRVAKGEIPGLKSGLNFGQLKGILPVSEDAFACWEKFAKLLLNHVNPYTGIAWKDDPALAFLVAVNEDTLMSICGGRPAERGKKAKLGNPHFMEAFAKYKDGILGLDVLEDMDDEELGMDFLIETGVSIQRRYGAALRKIGYRGLVSGANWWDLKFSAYEREELGLVDNHGYVDHPNGSEGGFWWNQVSNVKCPHAAYQEPILKAPTRIFGKPMSITEWQFCMPNQYRAESGPTMGAYAGLQDWDALYRFAWSHDAKNILGQQPMSNRTSFDMSTDPLNQISERLTVLLFRRGDISPAREAYLYAVTKDDVRKSGMGDMWGKGIFPNRFVTQGFLHRIGSQVVEEGKPVRGSYSRVVTSAKKCDIPKKLLNGNQWMSVSQLPELYRTTDDLISDTGEITLNRKGRLVITAPRTEAIVAYPEGVEGDGYRAGGLFLGKVSSYTTVAASSLDGAELRQSRQVLVFHLTNVYNSGMEFDAAHLHAILSNGMLPYLARCGKANLQFKSDVPGLKLRALRYDGTPIREIPVRYEAGAYSFTLEISPREEAVMMYVLGD